MSSKGDRGQGGAAGAARADNAGRAGNAGRAHEVHAAGAQATAPRAATFTAGASPVPPLAQASATLSVQTRGVGFYDITAETQRWLHAIDADEGLLTVFIRHTSASLVIQENADPDVQADLLEALARLAPEDAGYRHTMEGPDDMPAHIRSMVTSVSIGIPVLARRLRLGTWQGLYVVEHRRAAHERQVACHFMGRLGA